MSAADIKNTLENIQLKIAEYSLAEAKAKAEKAQVELETAKINQAYIREAIEQSSYSLDLNDDTKGGIKS